MTEFIQFSKPFLDAMTETFNLMVHTKIKAHSPKLKTDNKAKGDITSMIGMTGIINKDGKEKNFKGLLAISWPEPLYIKLAGRMLMEEYTEYNDDIRDAGSEICNIIMGNAKAGLNKLGFKLDMASPSTIRGKNHEINYPQKTSIVEVIVSCDLGDFTLELCYQEF